MKKNRFLIALIAASMSLAGCGKKKPEQPSSSGGDEGGQVDPDALTPAQQQEANEIKLTLDTYLGYMVESSVVSECNEYTVAYSEEIVRKGVRSGAVGAGIAHLAVLLLASDTDAEAVIDFVLEEYECGTLRDTLYGGVALGKTFLRAASKTAEEEEKAQIEFVADFLDKQGTDLHENLYGLVDGIVGFMSTIASDQFIAAAGSIYDPEENQIVPASVSATLRMAGQAICDLTSVADHVKYFADLVADGVVKYLDDFTEDTEEIIEAIEDIDFDGIITTVFSYINIGGGALGFLSDESSPIYYVIDLANLVLKEEYEELLVKVISDYFTLIGTEVTLDAIGTEIEAISEIVEGVAEGFSSVEFEGKVQAVVTAADKESAVASIKELVLAVKDNLAPVLNAEDHVGKLGDYIVDIIKCSLVVVCRYSPDEATAALAGFDVDEFVATLFNGVSDTLEMLQGFASSDEYDDLLGLVKDILDIAVGEEGEADEKYENIVEVFCNFVGDYFEIDAEKMASVKSALLTPNKIKDVVDLFKTMSGSTSLVDFLITTNPDTGVRTVNEINLKLVDLFVSMLSYSFSELAGDWVVTIDVVEEIHGKLDEDYVSDPESVYSTLREIFGSIQSGLASVYEFCSDADKVEELVGMIAAYGNVALEGYGIVEGIFETGEVDAYVVAEYLTRVISMFAELESTPVEITSFDEIGEKVGEAIQIEIINSVIEAHGSEEFSGHGVAYEVKEDEGVYTVEITLVNSYEVVVANGEVTSVSVEGCVFVIELPSFDFASEIAGGEEAVDLAPINE